MLRQATKLYAAGLIAHIDCLWWGGTNSADDTEEDEEIMSEDYKRIALQYLDRAKREWDAVKKSGSIVSAFKCGIYIAEAKKFADCSPAGGWVEKEIKEFEEEVMRRK